MSLTTPTPEDIRLWIIVGDPSMQRMNLPILPTADAVVMYPTFGFARWALHLIYLHHSPVRAMR